MLVEKGRVNIDEVIEWLASDTAAGAVADWKKEHGCSPHPYFIVEDIMYGGTVAQGMKRKKST